MQTNKAGDSGMQSFSLSKRNPRGKQGTARHMQALAFLKKQREREEVRDTLSSGGLASRLSGAGRRCSHGLSLGGAGNRWSHPGSAQRKRVILALLGPCGRTHGSAKRKRKTGSRRAREDARLRVRLLLRADAHGRTSGTWPRVGKKLQRVCLSLSLLNPLLFSLFPRDFLYARAHGRTEGGKSPAQERFPALGPFPFPRAAAHAYGDRLKLVGDAPDA